MPGRPRKPTRLKIIAGTANPSYINPDEPDVHPPKIPTAPGDLSDLEKTMWERFATVIEPMKIATDGDFMLFQSLVTAAAQQLELEATIRAYPLESRYAYDTFSAKGGYMRRPRPELSSLREVKREVIALCTKFGLSPADRSRVSMDRSNDGNRKTKEGEFKKRRA